MLKSIENQFEKMRIDKNESKLQNNNSKDQKDEKMINISSLKENQILDVVHRIEK